MNIDRWLANFCLIGVLILGTMKSQAADHCEPLFLNDLQQNQNTPEFIEQMIDPGLDPVSGKSRNPIRLTLDAKIPDTHRSTIIATTNAVSHLFAAEILPEKILFDLTNSEQFEGGAADLAQDSIHLTPVALRLSPRSFQALIAHELTHFVVIRRLSDGAKTLRQQLEENQQDKLTQLMLVRRQAPFAELLCDLSAVLVTGDLQVIQKMILEMGSIVANHPAEFAQLQGLLEKATMDQPRELSLRDFSISDNDPRWSTYDPREPDYNRMNQVRAYLGRRLSQVPKAQWAQLASPVLDRLATIFPTGQYDTLTAMQGIFTANQALIQYLDQTVEIKNRDGAR